MDLADVVGGTRDLVFDQLAAFQGGDLGRFWPDVHTHQVAANSLAFPGAAAASLQLFLVEFDGFARRDRLNWRRAAALALATLLLLLVAILVLSALATSAATTATTATTPAPTLLGLAVTALVLCAIAAVLAILVALIAVAVIALRGGAGIADLGGRPAVADLRLGLSGGRASLACSPPLWRLGVSFWACSSAMMFVFRRRRSGGDHATPTGAGRAAATLIGSWRSPSSVVIHGEPGGLVAR